MRIINKKVTHNDYIPKNEEEVEEIEKIIRDVKEEEAGEDFDLSELKKPPSKKPLISK